MKKGSFKEFYDYSEIAQNYEERKEKIEKGGLMMKVFDQNTFVGDKPNWLKDLFRKVDDYCTSQKKGVQRTFLETYTRYTYKSKMFCKMKSTMVALKIYLKLEYSELESPPRWVRDYKPVARQIWVELTLKERDLEDNQTILLDQVHGLIGRSFNQVQKNPRLSKFPAFRKKAVTPNFIDPTTKLKFSIEVGTDGFCQLGIRIHRSQLTKVLEKLLE